jgi:uncharacterized protein YndB with AHSA1/START domain
MTETHALRIERLLAASPARARAAWTDPAKLARWFAPGPMTATVHALDVRVGGQFEVTMHGPDGDHTATGRYTLVRDDMLVMTWNWTGDPLPADTTLRIEFHAHAAGTRLVLVHEGLPTQEAAAHHEQGWHGCLDNLPRVL